MISRSACASSRVPAASESVTSSTRQKGWCPARPMPSMMMVASRKTPAGASSAAAGNQATSRAAPRGGAIVRIEELLRPAGGETGTRGRKVNGLAAERIHETQAFRGSRLQSFALPAQRQGGPVVAVAERLRAEDVMDAGRAGRPGGGADR